MRRVLALPYRWWARQSLRARLTLITTALFALAVATGAVLLVVLQRYALTKVLDEAALKTGRNVVKLIDSDKLTPIVPASTGGVAGVQVLLTDSTGIHVVAASQGEDPYQSILSPSELAAVRSGERIEIASPTSNARLRVLGLRAGARTVVVVTDVTRVDDSVRIVERAALIGAPLIVLLIGIATYLVAALTLRPVAALRHGAADITAAGLARQRLPVPDARDEIHRLAVTLNAMLDRIDTATSRQRTFAGDAAHELRSPLASLRVQLEVAQRIGAGPELIDDVLVDLDRLDRLVEDLLSLARSDESAALTRVEAVPLDEVVETVVAGYGHARVTVTARTSPVTVAGDPDALRRVAINLIDNAVRHAAAGVTVEVERTKRNGRDVAVLTVTDDGPGIPAEERERVFDRFYRLQESRSRESGGTGLGLPIVRDIVRNHGGRIRLTARPDQRPGLHAVVVIPLQPATT